LLRLVWTTDLHLDHAPTEMRERWLSLIANQTPAGLLIGGDIAESGSSLDWLRQLAYSTSCPIYFVLGNHDFYDQSIRITRQNVVRLCREHEHLHYLTDCGSIPLRDATSHQVAAYLIGEDAWGDGTCGNFEKSFVKLADFSRILDFKTLSQEKRKDLLIELGRLSAERLTTKLESVPESTERVIILTHVPPFVEACWYEGKTADEHWSPFFVCGQMGVVLRKFAEMRPRCQVVVLCGHTHHQGVTQPLENLIVHTGQSVIGHPSIVGTLIIDNQEIAIETYSDPI